MRYPVTPTASVDADQERLICDEETPVAVKFAGILGAVVSVEPLLTHACVLQDWEVDGFVVVQDESEVRAPSFRRHSTVRVCVPPPQESEHDPHDHSDHEYV